LGLKFDIEVWFFLGKGFLVFVLGVPCFLGFGNFCMR